MDLLDHLISLDVEDGPHMLMPSMGIACGAPFSAVRVVLATAEVKCSACLDAFGGLDGLRAEVARQQGHQAPATN